MCWNRQKSLYYGFISEPASERILKIGCNFDRDRPRDLHLPFLDHNVG